MGSNTRGGMRAACDLCIRVPSQATARVMRCTSRPGLQSASSLRSGWLSHEIEVSALPCSGTTATNIDQLLFPRSLIGILRTTRVVSTTAGG